MMLQKLLMVIEDVTGIKPLPSAVKGRMGIAYEWNLLSDNGALAQSTLQVRVISSDKSEIEDINKKIKRALISFGDGSPVPGVRSAFINGRSSLPIGDLHQTITNYQLKYRSE